MTRRLPRGGRRRAKYRPSATSSVTSWPNAVDRSSAVVGKQAWREPPGLRQKQAMAEAGESPSGRWVTWNRRAAGRKWLPVTVGDHPPRPPEVQAGGGFVERRTRHQSPQSALLALFCPPTARVLYVRLASAQALLHVDRAVKSTACSARALAQQAAGGDKIADASPHPLSAEN